jgi:hypothetical protein
VLNTTTIVKNDSNVKWTEDSGVVPKHGGDHWKEVTKLFLFSAADRRPAGLLDEIFWDGTGDGERYPTVRDGLRKSRRDVTIK